MAIYVRAAYLKSDIDKLIGLYPVDHPRYPELVGIQNAVYWLLNPTKHDDPLMDFRSLLDGSRSVKEE